MSSALYRPGVLAGVYPQREEIRPSWLDKAAATAVGRLRRYAFGRGPQVERFARAVDERAPGLDGLTEFELTARIQELRRKLYAHGLREDFAVQSFGVVREVAARRLGMRHYDVQLYGGWVMLRGGIAEMETGEGKTLTATLTASTAAMAGIPVHVVTVNDFLAERDAQWMGPIYKALGLRVGTVTEDLDAAERRRAYSCDVVYCTNKQLVFDYLKDRLVLGGENRALHLKLEELYAETPRVHALMMRGLCFAIVDEADSVLIDEARTPLIIANRRSMEDEESAYRQAIRIARALERPRDFGVDGWQQRIELTDLGKARAARLAQRLGGVWSGIKRREDLLRQALSALHLFEVDKHYLVRDGKVQIVDEYTGRVMPDRSWERGLHQMIEAKEGCPITGRQEALARISYQRFFQRYLRLAGMTGTAREVAGELWSVYGLKVVTVPTHRPTRRRSFGERLYANAERKWAQIVCRIRALHEEGRPVLVGTRSVQASERLSRALTLAGLPHRVLNARQDRHEADIIALAGQRAVITVATNMAGRGTDIRLAAGLAACGGLHVLATERHDASRIDRQLFGRGARQGDPGSYEVILSLDDELFAELLRGAAKRWLERLCRRDGTLHPWLGRALSLLAQSLAESRHRRLRGDLLKLDENLGDMLAFTGRGE